MFVHLEALFHSHSSAKQFSRTSCLGGCQSTPLRRCFLGLRLTALLSDEGKKRQIKVCTYVGWVRYSPEHQNIPYLAARKRRAASAATGFDPTNSVKASLKIHSRRKANMNEWTKSHRLCEKLCFQTAALVDNSMHALVRILLQSSDCN
jgi:hypothetical protein